MFRLGKIRPEEENGVLYYVKYIIEDNGNILEVRRVIDDKNVPGSTLAARRLRLLQDKYNLHKLRHCIFFLADLVKLSSGNTWFIDATGKLFQYQKSTYARLFFRKITKVFPLPAGGAVIEVTGIPNRFKVLFTPDKTKQWAGILLLTNGYILYGLYEEEHPPSRRKV